MDTEKLKKLRVEHKKTQLEIAHLIGLKTASAYNKKENGKVPLTLEEAKILADFYEVGIESFLNVSVKQ